MSALSLVLEIEVGRHKREIADAFAAARARLMPPEPEKRTALSEQLDWFNALAGEARNRLLAAVYNNATLNQLSYGICVGSNAYNSGDSSFSNCAFYNTPFARPSWI